MGTNRPGGRRFDRAVAGCLYDCGTSEQTLFVAFEDDEGRNLGFTKLLSLGAKVVSKQDETHDRHKLLFFCCTAHS